MSDINPVPEWQLPSGVTRGLWDYFQSELVAEDYDDYFAFHRLFELDQQIVDKYLLADAATREEPPIVADLGCGTGRALIPLARKGLRGLAIDLSEHMLEVVRQKAELEDLPVDCVHANLVELDSVEDAQVDHAICLFSTLGMIRGRANRQQMLRHTHRILKPNGLLIVHVHNLWYNLYDPDGPWWLLRNLFQSAVDADLERGDKYFRYRGVSNMFLHVFTRAEIMRALRAANFRLVEVVSIDRAQMKPIAWPWLFGSLRACGWIIVCRKPA